MIVEQKQQEKKIVKVQPSGTELRSEHQRRHELDNLIREMAAHFQIKENNDQQAHYRSWRHALKVHVERYKDHYYGDD